MTNGNLTYVTWSDSFCMSWPLPKIGKPNTGRCDIDPTDWDVR